MFETGPPKALRVGENEKLTTELKALSLMQREIPDDNDMPVAETCL